MTEVLGIVVAVSSRESPDSHRMSYTALAASITTSSPLTAPDTVDCTVSAGTASAVQWWVKSGDKMLKLSMDTSDPYQLSVTIADARTWYEYLTGVADDPDPTLTFVAEVIGPDESIFVSKDIEVTEVS